MAEDMSRIISGIRSSYRKTNIREINLDSIMDASPEMRIGSLLSHTPAESRKDYRINFDPLENMFLEKMITQETLEKRTILTAEDFFKGMVYLDYFSTVIHQDPKLFDDLLDIAKEIEQRDRYADPNMELVVKYTGICYMYESAKMIRRPANRTDPASTYTARNKKYESDFMSAEKVSPAYQALGSFVCNLVENEAVKARLPQIKGLYDLKAALFVDSILKYIPGQPAGQPENQTERIIEKIDAGQYYDASVLAIKTLAKEVSARTSVGECIETLIQSIHDQRSLECNHDAGGNHNVDSNHNVNGNNTNIPYSPYSRPATDGHRGGR
jgi:hypothetical protein